MKASPFSTAVGPRDSSIVRLFFIAVGKDLYV